VKKILIIIAIFASLICIYALVNKESANDGKGDEIDMLKTNIPYSIRQNMSVGLRPKSIEKKYGKADITRKLEKILYEIRNMDDESKLFVIYNIDTNAVIDIWQLKKLLEYEEFQSIIAEKSDLNDIIKIDPYTTIIEKSENDAISEHRLKDGRSLLIDYSMENGEWMVDKVNMIDPDPSGFINTILPEDIKFIS
jgi:hypothetical protein